MGSLGKVKVDDVIRIPSAVKRFFDLNEGDYLEFYTSMEIPRYVTPRECIMVKIVRTKKGKKK